MQSDVFWKWFYKRASLCTFPRRGSLYVPRQFLCLVFGQNPANVPPSNSRQRNWRRTYKLPPSRNCSQWGTLIKPLPEHVTLHFVCWISWTRRNRQLQKRYSRMNSIQNNKVLTKQVKYSNGVYPIDLLLFSLTKPSIIVIKFNNYYTPLFALGICLFLRLWIRRIFWFVRSTAIHTRDHGIPATPLNFLYI